MPSQQSFDHGLGGSLRALSTERCRIQLDYRGVPKHAFVVNALLEYFPVPLTLPTRALWKRLVTGAKSL